MTAQHLRPLLAFVVVAILGAVIFANGLQKQVFDAIREGASVVAGTHLLQDPVLDVEQGEQIAPEEPAGTDTSAEPQAPDVNDTGSSSSASPATATAVAGLSTAGVAARSAVDGDQVAEPGGVTRGHEAPAANPVPKAGATPHPRTQHPAGEEKGYEGDDHGKGHQAAPGEGHGHGHDAAPRGDDSWSGKAKGDDNAPRGKANGHDDGHHGKAKGHDKGHEGKAKGHDKGHHGKAKGHDKGH